MLHDLLVRQSNDVLRSALHYVVASPSQPVDESEVVTPNCKRQSIAVFCNQNLDAEISCLPHCFGPGNLRKYSPVTTEYIVRRLREIYICSFSGWAARPLSTPLYDYRCRQVFSLWTRRGRLEWIFYLLFPKAFLCGRNVTREVRSFFLESDHLTTSELPYPRCRLRGRPHLR